MGYDTKLTLTLIIIWEGRGGKRRCGEVARGGREVQLRGQVETVMIYLPAVNGYS